VRGALTARGRCALALAGALALACGGCTQPAPAGEAAAALGPPACTAPAHRHFDFWLGEWDVHDAGGKLAGRNRIVSILGGCALQEHWSGASGVTGTSLSAYDADRDRWHQTWVDSGGGLLELDGGLSNGSMVLAGDAVDATAASKTSRQRIAWTPLPDGRVRQRWEASTDGGRTWTTVFDGLYTQRR
jgi:hypothetical protein